MAPVVGPKQILVQIIESTEATGVEIPDPGRVAVGRVVKLGAGVAGKLPFLRHGGPILFTTTGPALRHVSRGRVVIDSAAVLAGLMDAPHAEKGAGIKNGIQHDEGADFEDIVEYSSLPGEPTVPSDGPRGGRKTGGGDGGGHGAGGMGGS